MVEIFKSNIYQLFKLLKKCKQTVNKNSDKNAIAKIYSDCRDVLGKHLYILGNMKVKLFTHPLLKPDIHLLS
jgi:hypothetical protein